MDYKYNVYLGSCQGTTKQQRPLIIHSRVFFFFRLEVGDVRMSVGRVACLQVIYLKLAKNEGNYVNTVSFHVVILSYGHVNIRYLKKER